MTKRYGQMLLEAGLIQFGRFDGGNISLKLTLELLPSYPYVLQALADGISRLISTTSMPVERIVCTSDAFALGVAVSLKMGLPLVYSRGREQSPVYDLAGAYDVGHPAALLTSTIDLHSNGDLEHFRHRAATVGLNIIKTVGIVSFNVAKEYDSHTLINIPELVESLRVNGQFSREVADYILGRLGD